MSYGDLIGAFMGLGGFDTKEGESPLVELVRQNNNDSLAIEPTKPFCAALMSRILRREIRNPEPLKKDKLKEIISGLGLSLSRKRSETAALKKMMKTVVDRISYAQAAEDFLMSHPMIRLTHRAGLFKRKTRDLLPRGKIMKMRNLQITKKEIILKSDGKKRIFLAEIENGHVKITEKNEG